MQVRIVAPVRFTEDPERVRQAVRNLFPDATFREAPGALEAEASDLRPLRQRVWQLRIIDTFRGQFLHGMDAARTHTTFRISKQAALAGHVSFPATPHVLGDLAVTVAPGPEAPLDIERLAWWLAPETKDGEIVGPKDP
ncbi:MAG TPA: RNA-binding domain-containing protein [Candidatus Thermoplasmatota archaeon]|nr:RNA-binding domain-containing protein [Candidatus Thermoplasmatota archaeon]